MPPRSRIFANVKTLLEVDVSAKTTPSTKDTATQNGKDNYTVGNSVTTNPFTPGTQEFYSWIDGWNAMAWKDMGQSPPPPDKPKGVIG